MNNDEAWNSYFFENEIVLKNKFNIHDKNELKKKEYLIVTKKNILLALSNNNGEFVIDKLRFIHRFLFEDIYPFAGEFRYVNMGKEFTSSFTDYKDILPMLHYYLDDIDNYIINRATTKFRYAEALALMYYNLLLIHPFREGNGRTIREFLREYVEVNNKYFDNTIYRLDFDLDDDRKRQLEIYVTEYVHGNLVLLFNDILKEDKIIKEKKY